MTEVQLDGITKRYGTETAVEDVSLTVTDGEVLAVVGPSGCGKSTTLRTIAGFESPTEGRVTFDGKDVTGERPQDRNVGIVFQEYALFDNMTVLENVTFGPKMSGVPKGERQRRAEELLELVGIGGLADRRPASLSGGQQQRVGFVRALATEPDVLLLDEPMTGLDAKLKQRLRREIGVLLTELDVTTVYVTHDQTQAMAMADRLAVLNDGRLQQIDTPRTVYERPANGFVADFIGTSNLLSAKTNGDGRIDLGYAQVDGGGLATNGDEFTLVTRPEDFVVGDGPIEATVVDRYYLGETVQVLVELPDGSEVTLSLDSRSPEIDGAEPGGSLSVSLDPTRLHTVE